jgi:hypothetical protein
LSRSGAPRPALLGPETLRLALPLAVWKLALLGFVLLSWALLPPIFNRAAWFQSFHWPPDADPDLSSCFATWDAQHYLHLAREGYGSNPASSAYYPLWPWLVRGVAGVNGGHLLGGALALAFLLSWGGLLLFHAWAAERGGADRADRALLLLVASPGALFLGFPYSEALFLFLAAGFLLALQRDRPVAAASAAFLLALTRAVGVFAILPLVVHLLAPGRRRMLPLALAPAAGFGAVLLSMKLATGNPFAGFDAQQHFVTHPSLARLFDPGWYLHLVRIPIRLHGFFDSGIDRFFFLWFVFAVLLLARRRAATELAFALPLGFVPAVTVAFMSFTRYFVAILPVFPESAALFDDPKWRPAFWLVVGLLLLLQILFLLRHANFIWAG